MWPNDKSMDGLQKRLRNISRENARILVNVANAGQYGLYMGDICKAFALSRNDAMARVATLQDDGLVKILSLTDMNVRLNDDMDKLLSPRTADFLTSYLGVKPTKTQKLGPNG
jgi:hypothetical protein